MASCAARHAIVFSGGSRIPVRGKQRCNVYANPRSVAVRATLRSLGCLGRPRSRSCRLRML